VAWLGTQSTTNDLRKRSLEEHLNELGDQEMDYGTKNALRRVESQSKENFEPTVRETTH